MKITAIATSVVLLSSFCSMDALAATYTSYGMGMVSCGTWTQARARRSQFGADDEHALTEWAEGYLSATGYQGVHMRKTDAEGIKSFLDAYCAKKPVAEFEDAVKALSDALAQ